MKKSVKLLCVVMLVSILLFISYLITNMITKDSYCRKYQTNIIENEKKHNPVFKDKSTDNACVTYSYDIDRYNTFDVILQKITKHRFSKKVKAEIDKDKLRYYIDNDVSARFSVESKNARIVKGKTKYKIRSEEIGTQVDIDKLLSTLNNNSRGIDITRYFKQPKITSEDLQSEVNNINKYVNWKVTYTNGKTIRAGLENVYLGSDGKIIKNVEFIKSWVYQNLTSYSTIGKGFKFQSHRGKNLKVKGGTFGTIVDYEKEINYLEDLFRKGKTTKKDRTPEYSQNYNKIGKTYIEVDKSSQSVYFFKNGKIIMQSSCVTGQKGVHDTPSGTFFISECIPGKYLVGDGYRTWVNRWMRLTNMGIGLHDATWRGSFGGSIYTYSGSHGCINLPYSFACSLYKKVYVGMPVIVHY